MSKFKVGDRVRRTSNFSQSLGEFFQGSEFKVAVFNDNGGIIDPLGYSHGPEYLELVTGLPVRTVTRTEIVPGHYGRVVVGPHLAGRSRIDVSMTNPPGDPESLDAAELRAAARVFISLAEALEEKP